MEDNTIVIYSGTGLEETDIKKMLLSMNIKESTIVSKKMGNVSISQLFLGNYNKEYILARSPSIYGGNQLYAASYEYDYDNDLVGLYELMTQFFDKYKNLASDHLLMLEMYKDFGIKSFDIMKNNDFDCIVSLYDENTNILMVSKVGSVNLYYGFTDKNNEDIIFSNCKEAIQDVCSSIYDFPDNAYYMDGKIYSFDNILIDEVHVQKKKIAGSSDDLLADLSTTLSKLTSSTIKKEVDTVLQRLEPLIEDKVSKIIDDKISKINIPYIKVVKLGEMEIGRTNAEFFHSRFDEILKCVSLNEPLMLVGPAGSGKNHTVGQVAKALNLKMYYTNSVTNEFKLTGFIDAGGRYHETEFYKAFTNGGLFMLDELDASDPNAAIVINSALANGYMAFPCQTVEMHPDFRAVAAANTWGRGSDLQYVGRNPLDASTLDRFDFMYIDYDRDLESKLYPSQQVLDFMWAFRDSIEKCKIPFIVSTRGIGKVYKKEMHGMPIDLILETNIVKNLSLDDLNSIIGSIDIDDNNTYYSGLKKLVRVKEEKTKEKTYSDDEDDDDSELPF